jgi:hypothetical protein
VWRVEATFREVTAVMDHLRAEGIQRLVLEATSVIRRHLRAVCDGGLGMFWVVGVSVAAVLSAAAMLRM